MGIWGGPPGGSAGRGVQVSSGEVNELRHDQTAAWWGGGGGRGSGDLCGDYVETCQSLHSLKACEAQCLLVP
jgi:hypothetical protein